MASRGDGPSKPKRARLNKKGAYAESHERVTKDNLYMIIALWMQDFVKLLDSHEPVMDESVTDQPSCHNVGAVLVLPNDVILAADCSRDGVHAVARLLMKHSDKAEGCKVFVSRKPCPFCAKLLVQSKVKRVLFLPFQEPEYYPLDEADEAEAKKQTKQKKQTKKIKQAKPIKQTKQKKRTKPIKQTKQKKQTKPIKQTKQKKQTKRKKTDEEDEADNRMRQVDYIFTASAIAQTRFVFQVEGKVLDDASSKKDPRGEDKRRIENKKNELVKKYGFTKKWKNIVKKKLPWATFNADIDGQVQKYFNNAMKWMAQAMISSGKGPDYDFGLSELSSPAECKTIPDPEKGRELDDVFDPVKNPSHTKIAHHFITIARFLADRTDDPTTGVGAVIVSPKTMDILAFGWNGFPFKAYYGEFARASDKDPAKDKKYPYVIHAEQNAILLGNTKNFKDAILFLTNRTPCDECVPLIAMAGVKTVVTDEVERKEERKGKKLSYKLFGEKVKSGNFVWYKTQKQESPVGASQDKTKVQKNLVEKMDYNQRNI